MTLLVIFADGHGQLRIQATRAPQIRRREISRQTGRAEIVFCAVPVPGVSPSLVKMGFGTLPIMAAGGWKSHEVVARYTAHVELNPWQD